MRTEQTPAIERRHRPRPPRDPRVLIIDPDRELVETIAHALSEAGYTVLRAFDGEQGLGLLAEESPHVVLLELLLPKRSGLDVFRMIRTASKLPVIFFSARSSETDRIVSLELGADDFVTKPFSSRELIARVGAVLRRSCSNCRSLNGAREPASLELDRGSFQARRKGRTVGLTRTEFHILDALARKPGQILSRAQLLEQFSSDGEVFDRTLDKHIANLRKKIEENPSNPRHLVTVFGQGYKYEP
jgi:DNA-binding response OmpR family regulator